MGFVFSIAMPGTYSCISSLMLLGLPISLEGEDSG